MRGICWLMKLFHPTESIRTWILLISLFSVYIESANDCKPKETAAVANEQEWCKSGSSSKTLCEEKLDIECTPDHHCCIDLKQYCGEYTDQGKTKYREIQKPANKNDTFVYCEQKKDCSSGFTCMKSICCEDKQDVLENVCPSGSKTGGGCTDENKCLNRGQWCVEVSNSKNQQGHQTEYACCPEQKCPVTNMQPPTKEDKGKGIILPVCNINGSVGTDDGSSSGTCSDGQYCAPMKDYTDGGQRIHSQFLCCQIPYSSSYDKVKEHKYTETIQDSIMGTNTVEELGTTCQSHSDCSDDEFCDEIVGEKISFCYTKPSCAGTILLGSTGITLCKNDTNCPKDYFCDTFSSLKSSEYGVCCQAECPISDIEYTQSNPMNQYVVPKRNGGRCNADNQCIDVDKLAEHRGRCIELSSNVTGGKKNNMCCSYERIIAKCEDNEGTEGSKNATTGDTLQCSLDNECGDDKYAHCSGMKCCKYSTCDDGWTIRRYEKECASDADCYGDLVGSSMCLNSTENGENHKRCCPMYNPRVDNSMDKQKVYCTEVSCSDSSECGGSYRYCSKDSKCCYIGSTRINGEKHVSYEVKCTKSNPCPSSNEDAVCVYQEDPIKTGAHGECFYNPMMAALPKKATVNSIYRDMMIGFLLAAVIFLCLSMASYIKYRSKNMCDRKKKSKKESKDKKNDKKKENNKDDKDDEKKKKKGKKSDKSGKKSDKKKKSDKTAKSKSKKDETKDKKKEKKETSNKKK